MLMEKFWIGKLAALAFRGHCCSLQPTGNCRSTLDWRSGTNRVLTDGSGVRWSKVFWSGFTRFGEQCRRKNADLGGAFLWGCCWTQCFFQEYRRILWLYVARFLPYPSQQNRCSGWGRGLCWSTDPGLKLRAHTKRWDDNMKRIRHVG